MYYVKNNILHNIFTPSFHCEKNKLLYISHIPNVYRNYNTNDKNMSPKSYQTDSNRYINLRVKTLFLVRLNLCHMTCITRSAVRPKTHAH
jgi:hypothetical protein